MNSRWVTLLLLAACSVPGGALPEFGGADSGVDGAIDSGMDASFDSSVDAPGIDAAIDAAIDAPTVDSGEDAAVDAGCGVVGERSCAGSTLQECTPAGLVDVRECLRGCATDICTAYDVRNVTLDRQVVL